MEETTLSPPPISPTEGGDPCEIDAASVAIDTVTLLISLCGLAGNGAVLCLLRLESRNTRIFDMAVTDFLFLLFTFPSALLFVVEDVSCSPIMSLMYLSFLFQLSVVSYYWGLFRLTGFSLGDMKFLCQLHCLCRLPKRLLWVLNSVEYWAFFTAIIVIPSVTSLCPSHEQEQCQTALISMYALILLLCAAPTVIVSTIKFIKAKCGSQKQQQPKRWDIVIFLLVLFSLLLFLCTILQQLGYIVVSSHVFFLLTCINSSIKPFIYFLVGQCWRPCSVGSLQLSLQRVFEGQKEKTPSRNYASKITVI